LQGNTFSYPFNHIDQWFKNTRTTKISPESSFISLKQLNQISTEMLKAPLPHSSVLSGSISPKGAPGITSSPIRSKLIASRRKTNPIYPVNVTAHVGCNMPDFV